MRYCELLRKGETYLEEHNVPEAKLNAWYLFSACFQMERSSYFLHEQDEASEQQTELFEKYLERRSTREPLEHILGETEFMGLRFFVNENVLIPRQDTECLVERMLPLTEGKKVLDLCTGSGCIGISLAKLGNCASMTLSDISEKALEVTKKNISENQVQVTVVQGDLFERVKDQHFDCIISNPPYIQTAVVEELMPEVRDFEPHLALDGKEDGMFFYNKIIEESVDYLNVDGILAFEIGYDQGKLVADKMRECGFRDIQVEKDLAGLDRIVIGRR